MEIINVSTERGKEKMGEVKKMRSQEQLGGWMDWPRDLPHITGET